MRIALEASYIGHGFVDPEGGTGLSRVALELSKRMLSRREMKIFFAFLYLPHSLTPTVNYFLGNGYNIDVLFKNPSFEETIYKIFFNFSQFPHKYGFMLYMAELLQFPKKRLLLEEIDIFHSLYFALPRYISSARFVRFVTVHDLIPHLFPEYSKGFQRRRVKRLLRNLDINNDWVICVSECTKHDLCDVTDISEDRVFVIYWAASKDIFYPVVDSRHRNTVLKKLGIPTDKPYFLSVATIEPRKNHLFNIRCFKRILDEPGMSDMRFVIVGKYGWKMGGFFEMMQSDRHLKKRVVFTGFIEDQYLAPLYSQATAFVYTPLYEGFGLPPLEAMQCGTPVITSNTSSLPEVVGDAGIMIHPEDEDALCQAMVDIAKDSKLRKRLSIKGIERARQFSWEKCADETINAYKFALENR